MAFTEQQLRTAFLSAQIQLPNGSTKNVNDILGDIRGYAYNGEKARSEDSARDAQLNDAIDALAAAVGVLDLGPEDLAPAVEQAVSTLLESGSVEVRITVNDGTSTPVTGGECDGNGE